MTAELAVLAAGIALMVWAIWLDHRWWTPLLTWGALFPVMYLADWVAGR